MHKLKCYKCGKEIWYSNGGLKKRICKSKIFCFDCEMKVFERKIAKSRKIQEKLDN